MWIARDKNGTVNLFLNKPFKNGNEWTDERDFFIVNYEYGDYPVSWNDEEPVEVSIISKSELLALEHMTALYREEHNENLYIVEED